MVIHAYMCVHRTLGFGKNKQCLKPVSCFLCVEYCSILPGPSIFLKKKKKKATEGETRTYAQNEAQKEHYQRIFRLL